MTLPDNQHGNAAPDEWDGSDPHALVAAFDHMRTDTFDAWLDRQRQHDGGTHYDGCFRHHPGCAAALAAEAARAQDVAWLRECEATATTPEAASDLHCAADGIEQGWAFLSRDTTEAPR
jgi:hypothetical protein